MYYSIAIRQKPAVKDLMVDKNILVQRQLTEKAAGEGPLTTWMDEYMRHLLCCNLFSITADLGNEPRCLDFQYHSGEVAFFFASVYAL